MSAQQPGWDIMFWRKKHESAYGDASTDKLLSKGIFSVQRPEKAQERRFFRKREYNLLSGMWYVFILSCLLWWLAPFGQMIAGYIGGRKAGSPSKGILVTIIPAGIILLLIIGMDLGMLPFLGAIAALPGMMMNSIQNLSPQAGHFLSGIYSALRPVVGLEGSGFMVIVAFGMIGGIMADMNKKEIMHATGNAHFYDPFVDKLSGASLNKFADMVAERVIWTLSTIDHGGKSLMGRMHHEPTAIGFADLKSLPAASKSSTPYINPENVISHEPIKESRYDALQPQDDEPMPENNYSMVRAPARSQVGREEVRGAGRKAVRGPSGLNENDLEISHRDLTEENMVKQWKEHKKSMENGRFKGRNSRNVKGRAERFRTQTKAANLGTNEKRDAIVYDNSGKLIDIGETKRKSKSSLIKKQPALITRAMASNKKIEAKHSPKKVQQTPKQTAKETDLPKEQEKARRIKPEKSYDRL